MGTFGNRTRNGTNGARFTTAVLFRNLEAPPGFEPGMEVLQTSALPLGYGAVEGWRLASESGGQSIRRRTSVLSRSVGLCGRSLDEHSHAWPAFAASRLRRGNHSGTSCRRA